MTLALQEVTMHAQHQIWCANAGLVKPCRVKGALDLTLGLPSRPDEAPLLAHNDAPGREYAMHEETLETYLSSSWF